MARRLLALVLCLAGALGIGLEINAQVENGASLAGAAWQAFRYFTIITNALVALVFGLIALRGDRFDHPRLVAGVVAAIALVGVVFALLLQGLRDVAGATALANFLLHQFNPLVAVVFWFAFEPKGRLGFRDPLLWALYPLAYLGYALARGAADGRYPYPFIDVAALGAAQVALNAAAIAVAFVAVGGAMVWLDRALARRRSAR